MTKDQLIQTPYGKKRASYLCRAMDVESSGVLDALKAMTAELIDAHDVHIYDDDDPHPDDCQYCAIIKEARLAILKAEGVKP
jgi:hypothetical protein